MTLPNDKQERKNAPMARGVLDYFPDALFAVANLSLVANEQHNPGQPMHWAKEKSTDHADCIMRHLVDRGSLDDDGIRHSAKVAWRALALLQTEIEGETARQSGAERGAGHGGNIWEVDGCTGTINGPARVSRIVDRDGQAIAYRVTMATEGGDLPSLCDGEVTMMTMEHGLWRLPR